MDTSWLMYLSNGYILINVLFSNDFFMSMGLHFNLKENIILVFYVRLNRFFKTRIIKKNFEFRTQ